MKTMDDAVAISQRENDNFYVTAFMIEAWLGGVTLAIVEKYAETKPPKRRLQTGTARRIFEETFGHTSDDDFHHLFKSLLRFGGYDDPQSRTFQKAFWLTSQEMPIAGWPQTGSPITTKSLADFERSVALRFCDWIEAYTHDQVHSFSHHAPIAFDPDPEKRELAILGIQQRHFPEMGDFQKAWWEWHHGEAAERLIDPANWAMVGRAAADDQTTIQNYPALDQAIILFWPLVIRYNWTYRDLIAVIQSIAPTPVSYPCEREQDLASYCANVLGLRKDGQKGRTTKNGLPAGSTIAQALCAKGDGSVSS